MFKKLMRLFFGPSADFKELVKNGAMIVDVRSPGEYQSGHIKSSINIPLEKIKSQTDQLKKKNMVVITVCRSGSRSGMAKNILTAQGIKVYNGGPWNQLERKLTNP